MQAKNKKFNLKFEGTVDAISNGKASKITNAINAIWELEGVLTQDEILKMTGKLVGRKECLI